MQTIFSVDSIIFECHYFTGFKKLNEIAVKWLISKNNVWSEAKDVTTHFFRQHLYHASPTQLNRQPTFSLILLITGII